MCSVQEVTNSEPVLPFPVLTLPTPSCGGVRTYFCALVSSIETVTCEPFHVSSTKCYERICHSLQLKGHMTGVLVVTPLIRKRTV